MSVLVQGMCLCPRVCTGVCEAVSRRICMCRDVCSGVCVKLFMAGSVCEADCRVLSV